MVINAVLPYRTAMDMVPWSVPVRYFNLEPVVREILTLGEGFTTQVVTLWCFNTVLRPSALVP